MKRILSTILLCVTSLCAIAQEDVTLFFLNDGTFKGFYDEEIDSIAYSHFDLDSVWHSDAVVQEVWLADSVVRIPIEKIDSICHKVPEPEYKPGVIHLDERYLPYITSVEGLTIAFSSGLPDNLRPHEGDILVHEGSSDLFPEGFAGKVTAEGDRVTCEEADFQEVYNRLVFFGKYVLLSNDNEAGDSDKTSYSLRRLRRSSKKSKTKDDEDYGIDNWRMGDGDIPDISLGTVQKAVKFELKKIHTSVKLNSKITPVVSIEYAYDGYWLNPLLFYKCTFTNNYDLKIKADFNLFEWKPKDDTTFWGENEPDWFELYPVMDNSDESDDENCQSIYIADQEVPIPEFPLLKVGFKIGFFFEPKIEGSLSAGLTMKGTAERTYIYNLDKNHWLSLSDDWKDYLLPWRSSTMKYFKIGEGKIYKGPTTCENDWFFEGSAKASAWLGLIAAANVSVGISKNAEAKEEVKLRIGPYIEGEIKANFKEANEDKSWYSMLKDSKIKNGVKLGIDLQFSAKLKSKEKEWFGATWDQFDWSPKELLWESNMYLLPDFTAPKYTIRGNSLTCTSELTRKTLSNRIGFALYDETGKEKRIYGESMFKNYKADNPYLLTLTFDNLDFAHHRYTIVPTTRPFDLKVLQMDLPDQYQTTVLCPDSRHPHLIDLGLPSGTKWLCSNLYADDPKDAGGYYQWGMPYMVHSYADLTYRAPNFTMPNYQSSEYDAATANLGQEYCTPTMAQFIELHDNCSMEYKYSPWGNNVLGLFLRGKNGNNLYLPFSGFKSGVKVNNDSNGWFLSSDAVDSDKNLERKAIVIKNNDVIWIANDAKAYGYSVRPVSASSEGLVFEPQQLDYEEGYVDQKVGQYVTITNNGSTPVNVTVVQTIAPFQVDEACLGTFTVKPKELHSILVNFLPTEEKEYTSVLTLSYEADNTCIVSKVPLRGKGINVSNIPLQISQNTITLTTSQQGTVDVTSGSGNYAAVSNATNIATVTVEGSKVVINAVAPGTATITVKDNLTQKKEKIEVTVTESSGPTPDPGNHDWVDLGLPSGTLWATCNVGANRPEEYGDYYTFDDAQAYNPPSLDQIMEMLDFCSSEWTTQNGMNGRKFTGANGNSIFLPAAGFVWDGELAFVGSDGRYWSSTQEGSYPYFIRGLLFNSDGTSRLTSARYRGDGLSVRPVRIRLTGITMSRTSLSLAVGTTKTLAATIEPDNASIKTLVWSSSDESVVTVSSSGHVTAVGEGSCVITCSATDGSGMKAECQVTVTAEGDITVYKSCPNQNHPHMIDLDLPSGTLWACCNVGANSPEKYGDYFAWGETTGYTSDTSDGRLFDWSSYKWMNEGQSHWQQINKYQVKDGMDDSCWYDSDGNFIGDGKGTLDLSDDAARANWGGQWVMPTYKDVLELLDYTTNEPKTVNDVNGWLFTSKTYGSSIFLPAAGHRLGSMFGAHAYGLYWSASVNPSNSDSALYFFFGSEGVHTDDADRIYGLSVRPVLRK